MLQDVERHGYYGGVRLIKAAIKKLHAHLHAQGRELPPRNFTIEYDTDIPVRVGLAGSSAIVTATLRALLEFFEISVEKPVLPNLILSVERDELGIGAGLQDRVAQVYEGAVFMDFERARMEKLGHGLYEPLAPAKPGSRLSTGRFVAPPPRSVLNRFTSTHLPRRAPRPRRPPVPPGEGRDGCRSARGASTGGGLHGVRPPVASPR